MLSELSGCIRIAGRERKTDHPDRPIQFLCRIDVSDRPSAPWPVVLLAPE